MAEVPNGAAPQPGAGAPASAPAGQPATFTVPEGHRLVRSDEYEGLTRYAEKGRGADKFYSKARELGFEKPEDFDSWKPAFDTFKTRKLDPGFLSKAFGAQALEDEDEGHSKATQFDPVKYKDEIKSEWRKEQAQAEWNAGFKSEKSVIEKAVAAIAEEAPFKGAMLRRAVANALEDVRGVLPEDHPLGRGQPEYLTESHIAKAHELLKKEWAEEKAAALASKGDRVRASERSVPTAAQPGTRQGAPSTESNRGPRERIKDAIDNAKAKLNIPAYGS